MNPRQLDVDVVARRLRMMRTALDSLEELRDVDVARLEAEPLTRAAAERLVQAVVDLAVEVNAHLALVDTGAAPATARASFRAAASAGAISTDLAARLEPAAGMRNVLVHQYVDIDLGVLATSIADVLDGFGEFVRVVAGHIGSGT